MTSVIYYRFRNALKQESVSFDGAVIQVGDVKRLIATSLGVLADASEELLLFDPGSNAEYKDDSKLLPRNSLVLVKRQPIAAARPLDRTGQSGPGGSRAAAAQAAGGYSLNPSVGTTAPASGEGGEDAALADLVRGAAAAWKKEVAVGYSRFRAQNRARAGGQDQPRPDYRCPICDAVGQHWASDCPKAGEGGSERPPPGRRALAPVGIPASRLAAAADGSLVLPNGSVGTLLANEAAFARDVAGLPTASAPRRDQSSRLALRARGEDDDEAPLGLPGVPGWAPAGGDGGGSVGGDADRPLALPGAAALLPPRPPSAAKAAADDDEPVLALPHLAAAYGAGGQAKGADRGGAAAQAQATPAGPHDDDSELSEDEAFPPPPVLRAPTLKRRRCRTSRGAEAGGSRVLGLPAGGAVAAAAAAGGGPAPPALPWAGPVAGVASAHGGSAGGAGPPSGGLSGGAPFGGPANSPPGGAPFAASLGAPPSGGAPFAASLGAPPSGGAPFPAPLFQGGNAALPSASLFPPPAAPAARSRRFAAALAAGALPPGPPAFLAAAFDRDEPLSPRAFESLQAEQRALLGLPLLDGAKRRRGGGRDRSPGESVGQSRDRREPRRGVRPRA